VPTPPAIAEELHELHEDSADRVNRLVAEDREDPVWERPTATPRRHGG
jgi:hypothetical protein